jgi:hypothetical protein
VPASCPLAAITMESKTCAAFAASRRTVDASLEEYSAFHGMLCRWSASIRCIESFDGSLLFADYQNYEKSGKDLASIDFNRPPFNFNVGFYYLLVLYSFTGLCTLLGQTKFTCQKPEKQRFTLGNKKYIYSEFHKELRVTPEAIDYLLERSQAVSSSTASAPELVLTQRFEYEFGNYLSVMMLHFTCSAGQKHLVEVYNCRIPLIGSVASAVKKVIRFALEFAGSRRTKVE